MGRHTPQRGWGRGACYITLDLSQERDWVGENSADIDDGMEEGRSARLTDGGVTSSEMGCAYRRLLF